MSNQPSMGSLLEEGQGGGQDRQAASTPATKSNEGRWANAKLIAGIVTLVAALVIIVVQMLGGETPGDLSRRRTVIDAQTLEVLEEFPITDGGAQPWTNPKTGKKSLYMAEKCFWTKDGKAKTKPTFVLLNNYAGKPGDTICPDCGRKVVGHNPMPPMELINQALAAEGHTEPKADPKGK